MNAPYLPQISTHSEVDCASLVRLSLQRAATTPAVFTRCYPQAAMAAAVQADHARKAGLPVSAIAGLPVSIKDLCDVAGETTLAGSIVLKGEPPATADASVVARLRAAGAALIGKTNMSEFAFSGIGLNPHYGTPVNPADPTVARIPGGSSSGAAVSVAAGICVAAVGSDTGGSIRIPAALCGLVGFKPTMRRVPVTGTNPLSPTLDTICAMTRSVRDCLLVDAIMADVPLKPEPLNLRGMRLAVPGGVVVENLEPHVAQSFAAALSLLSAAGAALFEVPMPLLAEARALNFFGSIESYARYRDLLDTRGDDVDFRVAKRMRLGAAFSEQDITQLHQTRQQWIGQMDVALAGFDAMLMPTVPMVAPAIAPLEASEDLFWATNLALLRNPSIVNLLDGCAVSLPCHAPGTLPVGLMVAGSAMTDARVMAVALAIEAALKTRTEAR